MTGQVFAWAIVTGPYVSSPADSVEGDDVAGAPVPPGLPLGVQVTRVIATAMAQIRGALPERAFTVTDPYALRPEGPMGSLNMLSLRSKLASPTLRPQPLP